MLLVACHGPPIPTAEEMYVELRTGIVPLTAPGKRRKANPYMKSIVNLASRTKSGKFLTLSRSFSLSASRSA